MGVLSTNPTSRRGYLSQAELAQYANITITDTNEADDVISQAEELIDAYVGFQDPFLSSDAYHGKLSQTNGSTSHTLDTDQSGYGDNFFLDCEIEIIGGTGRGQRRKITASTNAGVITTDAFTTALDTTSYYRINQIGKFPRKEDIFTDTESGVTKYYKAIPEEVKRAVAAQVQFIIEMGDDFFRSDKADKESESIGDYSYTKAKGSGRTARLIAPKAREYLRGIVNRVGTILI